MILAGPDSDAVGLQNESGHEGQGGQMHHMHALYMQWPEAVCLGSRLRG